MDQQIQNNPLNQSQNNKNNSNQQLPVNNPINNTQLSSININNFNFQPPSKNPQQVFSSKLSPTSNIQNLNLIDDNKSQASQKSIQSTQRKRKGSFLQRMSEIQQSEQQKLNQKRKADLKSVFLQNVDYKTTKQELQLIFQDCAQIDRITILKDPYTNHPKGCAYISFHTQQGVQRALNLNGVTLRNRVIKVHRKRTNLPGKNKIKKQDINMNILGIMQNFNRSNIRGRGRGRGR